MPRDFEPLFQRNRVFEQRVLTLSSTWQETVECVRLPDVHQEERHSIGVLIEQFPQPTGRIPKRRSSVAAEHQRNRPGVGSTQGLLEANSLAGPINLVEPGQVEVGRPRSAMG